jgi:hypothetical protein
VVMQIRTRKIALLTLGLGWLAGVLWMIVGNVVLRGTRLGFIAQFLDKLPPTITNPLFIFLWIVTLFGWVVPLTLGVIGLLRKKPPN